jgi:hypothetical protein
MVLYSSRSVREVLQRDSNAAALRILEERLNAVRWAVYRVRRIVWGRGRADRRTERLSEGNRKEITRELTRMGGGIDAASGAGPANCPTPTAASTPRGQTTP